MIKTKVIRDSVHGDIFLTDLELEIVDQSEFQRLRRIKQLGSTYFVYPGANHTRFEHSIGTLHLAGRIGEKLGLEDGEESKLRISALLHDIGHGPLSHTSEELLERYLGYPHERVTKKVIEGSGISDVLSNNGIEPKEISRIIMGGEGYLSKIISSEFDVDRMDYLVRDSHYTGVAYGIIDLDRLINTMEFFENSLVVSEGGLRAIEGLLVARFLMTPTVYLHHTSRVADAMFLRATERAIEDGILKYNLLYKMDDYDIQNLFRSSSGFIKDMGQKFDKRELFKKVYLKGWQEFDEKVRSRVIGLRKDIKKWKEIETRMAHDCGIEEGYVILDIPPVPTYEETGILVLVDDKVFKLDELSPLVNILKEAQKDQWSVGIYTPKESIKKVSKVRLEDYINF